jgi:hypothetical protein
MWDWLAPALQAGTALYGAYSANQAGQTAANAGNNALALQGQMYNQSRADSAPWRAAGQQVLPGLVAATQGGFQQSPGYQFQVDEALRQSNNRLAALGLTNSGAAQRETMRIAQGLAAQDYGNWFNRGAAVAGLGQAAQQQSNALGSQYGQTAGNVMQNIGGAVASAQNQGANALMQGANNLASWWSMNQKPAGYSGPAAYTGGNGAPSSAGWWG